METAYLGLSLTAVGSLAIPPSRPVTVDHMTRGTLDSDLGPRDRDQRSLPLFVSKAGSALEDDLICQQLLVELWCTCHTVVPSFSFVRSRVVPDGTATLLSTIVEQEVFDLLADAALVNVQLAARSSSLAAVVGVGAGAADTRAPAPRRKADRRAEIILTGKSECKEKRVNTMFR